MANAANSSLSESERLQVNEVSNGVKRERSRVESKSLTVRQPTAVSTEAASADAAIVAIEDVAVANSVAQNVTKRKSTNVRGGFGSALIAEMKANTGRSDIIFTQNSAAVVSSMDRIPLEDRAGYPLERPEGSVDPNDWVTSFGAKVVVSFVRAAWLPDSWGQGVKTTKPTGRPTNGGGGTLHAYVSPEGKVFYHKESSEKFAGRSFDHKDGFNGQIRFAKLKAQQGIQVARLAIKDVDSVSCQTSQIGVDSDESLFSILSAEERTCLAKKEDFHFCVVSARRATKVEGVKDIFMVQTQFLEAGVSPTWYVDEGSLSDYRALGLTAKVGGKLTAARNMALDDAQALGKVCVQVSDDISAWEYRDGASATTNDDKELNAAHAAARRLILSPVAAAQFILAKMRSAVEDSKPRLGGVYMLGSCARTFAGPPFSRRNFIIGDFFVADNSHVRFDTEMTLKEDYDFTCSHIRTHGCVLRCNRLTLNVKHYSNAGGACANRDAKGAEERKNLDILYNKWPRAFYPNPKRKNEVILRWPADDHADDHPKEQPVPIAPQENTLKRLRRTTSTIIDGRIQEACKKQVSRAEEVASEKIRKKRNASLPQVSPPKRTKRASSKTNSCDIENSLVEQVNTPKKPRLVAVADGEEARVSTVTPEKPDKSGAVASTIESDGSTKKLRRTSSSVAVDVPSDALLVQSGKVPVSKKVVERLRSIEGLTVSKALGLAVSDKPYRLGDLRYDLKQGYLIAKSPEN